jgi:hypothetical protein
VNKREEELSETKDPTLEVIAKMAGVGHVTAFQ